MRSGGDFEFAIVGGGLVGMALAYGLARRGPRVAVLDEGDRAFRASRGNFGLVWQQGKEQVAPYGDFQFNRDFGDMFGAPATNVFLVKISRWFNF